MPVSDFPGSMVATTDYGFITATGLNTQDDFTNFLKTPCDLINATPEGHVMFIVRPLSRIPFRLPVPLPLFESDCYYLLSFRDCQHPFKLFFISFKVLLRSPFRGRLPVCSIG
jgi:hypothetical protein